MKTFSLSLSTFFFDCKQSFLFFFVQREMAQIEVEGQISLTIDDDEISDCGSVSDETSPPSDPFSTFFFVCKQSFLFFFVPREMAQIEVEGQISLTIDDDEISDCGSVSDETSPPSDPFMCFKRDGLVEVSEGSPEHHVLRGSFLVGMRPVAKQTNVVAIHKNSSSSLTRKARFDSFRLFAEAVAEKCGGNAQESLSAKYPMEDALSSEVDEYGLRHVLLCRVILGDMEVVSPGSNQFHPSSQKFDSGVDNLSDPRRYIVWSAYMNSHIFPTFMISFKAPSLKDFQGLLQANVPRANVLKPTTPWMSFPALITILSRFLDPSKMALINKCYKDFRERKIRRPEFIRKLRIATGDEFIMKQNTNSCSTESTDAKGTRSMFAANIWDDLSMMATYRGIVYLLSLQLFNKFIKADAERSDSSNKIYQLWNICSKTLVCLTLLLHLDHLSL
nr:putative inactive poly [adp-ribose] polymerase sro2 [Quercus suber]